MLYQKIKIFLIATKTNTKAIQIKPISTNQRHSNPKLRVNRINLGVEGYCEYYICNWAQKITHKNSILIMVNKFTNEIEKKNRKEKKKGTNPEDVRA